MTKQTNNQAPAFNLAHDFTFTFFVYFILF